MAAWHGNVLPFPFPLSLLQMSRIFRGFFTFWGHGLDWMHRNKAAVLFSRPSNHWLYKSRIRRRKKKGIQFDSCFHCFEAAPLTVWTDLMQQVHMPPTGASCRKTHCHHQPYKQMEYFFRFTSWILNTFQGQCSFFFFLSSHPMWCFSGSSV